MMSKDIIIHTYTIMKNNLQSYESECDVNNNIFFFMNKKNFPKNKRLKKTDIKKRNPTVL